MRQYIPQCRQIPLLAKTDLRTVRRVNYNSAALTCVLLLLFGGVGVAQAQDPLTITNTGNVGIGTTLPANKLSVAGNADFTGNVGVGTSTPANKFSVAGNADFSGNVGVGTSSPANKLSVAGNVDFSGTVGIGTTGPANKLSVAGNADFSGNVGIGTATPANPLSVAGSADFSGNVGIGTTTPANKLSVGGNVDFAGNVGIGVTTPTKAKVEINGSLMSRFPGPPYGFLTNTQAGSSNVFLGFIPAFPVSLYADQSIIASSFFAISDARLKRIEGRSNAASDLATLMDIEITDYSFVDSVSKGTRMQKKVTGQQVEKVFPQAVTRNTDVVPDIYQKATMKDGWVTLATSLKKGERVRLIGEKSEGIHEVLEVAEGRFRTAFAAQDGQVFVYGREVNDARSVDYEAISMLNVSATQQIKKEKDEEVKTLREENAALRSQLTEQEKRLAEFEASAKTRDEKLAAIENLLLSRQEATTRSASLKKVN